ncbi:DNA binding protein [Microbacterium phage Honk]|uniref:DNA binding protein n=1 Tax=Microbacterium phage Honk TaxID=2836095 RepID=A0A8F3EA96_9CAUD|nr:DNA binding protein [Microbacterium phage Honk]
MLTTSAIRRVFEGTAENLPPLPIDVEVELIACAKDGDEAAYERLIANYIPGLRALAASELQRSGRLVDVDEVRANVLLAFVEAVHAARPGERVAPQLAPAAKHAADDFEHNLVAALSVPGRTQRRYFQAIREAKRNGTNPVDEAAALGLAPESFYAVKAALGFDSIERLQELNAPGVFDGIGVHEPAMSPIHVEQGYANAETRHMARAALAALNDDPVAAVIVREAYGFTGYEPVPDAEVAHRHGLTRPTVQRKRIKALDTMHEAICQHDAPEPRCAREHS